MEKETRSNIANAVAGKRVTIVGAARSGRAAAGLLARQGANVFLTERGAISPTVRNELEQSGVALEEGGHSPAAFEADFFVVSPGVPTEAPLIQEALQRGLAVYSEIEVASWFCRAPIVAITGSNGKTTTTALTGHIFRQSGRPTIVAGNIGQALSDYVEEASDKHVAIVEVSSFQLDHIDRFRPRVAILLNITPDHLDRYQYDLDLYAASKYRVFENLTETDTLIYNADDPRITTCVTQTLTSRSFRTLAISTSRDVEAGAFVRQEAIVVRVNQEEEVLMNRDGLALRGQHNLYNSLAAAIAARSMEVESHFVRESLSAFEGVTHRLEQVRELDGVTYYNDSKATNVNAVWYALESFQRPIILIAGGRDKGNDYSSLLPLVHDKVKAVLTIGESADRVGEALGSVSDCFHAGTLEQAVETARNLGSPGDVVLLSPACSSFDQFNNYEHRGEVFKELVHKL